MVSLLFHHCIAVMAFNVSPTMFDHTTRSAEFVRKLGIKKGVACTQPRRVAAM